MAESLSLPAAQADIVLTVTIPASLVPYWAEAHGGLAKPGESIEAFIVRYGATLAIQGRAARLKSEATIAHSAALEATHNQISDDFATMASGL
jgi:hypothetical protein